MALVEKPLGFMATFVLVGVLIQKKFFTESGPCDEEKASVPFPVAPWNLILQPHPPQAERLHDGLQRVSQVGLYVTMILFLILLEC